MELRGFEPNASPAPPPRTRTGDVVLERSSISINTRRISYEQILATLDAGLALAQRLSLNMELATTRFLTYRDDLRRLNDVVALRRRLGRLPQDVVDDLERRKAYYVAALVESAQFGEIARELAAVDADVLRPKLRDALRGPVLPTDEDANSNHARNTFFELVCWLISPFGHLD